MGATGEAASEDPPVLKEQRLQKAHSREKWGVEGSGPRSPTHLKVLAASVDVALSFFV